VMPAPPVEQKSPGPQGQMVGATADGEQIGHTNKYGEVLTAAPYLHYCSRFLRGGCPLCDGDTD
jgi:hypothetical protein